MVTSQKLDDEVECASVLFSGVRWGTLIGANCRKELHTNGTPSM